MKKFSLNSSGMLLVTAVCGVAIASGILLSRAYADQWDKKTVLTTNQPIQVQDKLLDPGQYVFKLLDSDSNRHVVQIFNGDQTQIIDTVLAIPTYRTQPTGKSQFTFWETPPGTAKALRTWYYPGDNFGQEFSYPEHLAMLQQPAPPAPPAVEPAPAPPVEQPEAAPPPEPQSMNQEPQPEEKPAEVAQNTQPEPPPVAPEPQPVPEQERPAALPKTASPYPLIGLTGLLSLSVLGLLRLKRWA